MLTVFLTLLTLLSAMCAPSFSQSEAEQKIQALTGGSVKAWVLVKIDDQRLGGAQKKCPAWTFDKNSRRVTQEDPACDGRSSTLSWDVVGTAPDIYVEINSKRYRIARIGKVASSDTEEMQLEDRSNGTNVKSTKYYFEHYP